MNIRHSFATRLSLSNILAAGALLIAVLAVSYFEVSKYLQKEMEHRATASLQGYSDCLRPVFWQVAGQYLILNVCVSEHLDDPDYYYSLTSDAINMFIRSSTIAFRPGLFPEKGEFFSPTCLLDSTTQLESHSFRYMQMGDGQYDYTQEEWYQWPRDHRAMWFTDPFYDDKVCHEEIILISLALVKDVATDYRTEGVYSLDSLYAEAAKMEDDFIGVFTVSVSLRTWNHLLEESARNNPEQLNGGRFFVVSSDKGQYINRGDSVHGAHELIGDDIAEGDTLTAAFVNSMLGSTKDTIANQSVTFNGESGRLFWFHNGNYNWNFCLFFPDAVYNHSLYTVRYIFIAVLLAGLLLLFIVSYVLARHISKPLEDFAHSADSIAKGNFDTVLPKVPTEDEMRHLHDSFLFMQQSLKRYISDIRAMTATQERIESELHIAHEIQMGMVPKVFPPFPERNDIDIYASLTPARQVGGDLYDFLIRDNRLFFIVGDVSGKGVPAALVMAVARTRFRTMAFHETDPAVIVGGLNNALVEGNDSNAFITVFVGVIDLATRHLVFCNGGHDAPVVLGSQRPAFMDVVPNLVVGIEHDFPFESQEMDLPAGTTLFLYTDGLNEAERSDKRQYGEDRILEALSRPADDAKAMVLNVLADVHAFVGDNEQSDDLTMMAIRVKRHK